ncbi:MAG TPA: sulfite exporter TauE/SafE family protein [Stellaceae bacterium]|nr:sulfite exporter TauE/SafE family protein [Stellaceae bacterium]
MSPAILILALVSGLFIGCIGIGGVLLVPVLTLIGVPVHAAIAASMFSYIFAGAIGTFLYARQGSIAWGSAAWLGAGAMPGAFAGALLASHLGADLLLALIGLVVIFAGTRALLRSGGLGEDGRIPPAPALAAIGFVIGAASAMTGSGGPLLLVPLLLSIRAPVLPAIGLSQAIQVPIALLASAGNLVAGNLDLGLALLLSTGVALGAGCGARAAHALPKKFLTRLAATVLLVVGALVLLRASHLFAWLG